MQDPLFSKRHRFLATFVGSTDLVKNIYYFLVTTTIIAVSLIVSAVKVSDWDWLSTKMEGSIQRIVELKTMCLLSAFQRYVISDEIANVYIKKIEDRKNKHIQNASFAKIVWIWKADCCKLFYEWNVVLFFSGSM